MFFIRGSSWLCNILIGITRISCRRAGRLNGLHRLSLLLVLPQESPASEGCCWSSSSGNSGRCCRLAANLYPILYPRRQVLGAISHTEDCSSYCCCSSCSFTDAQTHCITVCRRNLHDLLRLHFYRNFFSLRFFDSALTASPMGVIS